MCIYAKNLLFIIFLALTKRSTVLISEENPTENYTSDTCETLPIKSTFNNYFFVRIYRKISDYPIITDNNNRKVCLE